MLTTEATSLLFGPRAWAAIAMLVVVPVLVGLARLWWNVRMERVVRRSRRPGSSRRRPDDGLAGKRRIAESSARANASGPRYPVGKSPRLGSAPRAQSRARTDPDGFTHAADASPDDFGKLGRRGWSGALPDHGFHTAPPTGWKRLLVEGFGILPFLGGGKADPSWSPHHTGGTHHSGHHDSDASGHGGGQSGGHDGGGSGGHDGGGFGGHHGGV
jgi:hypothetical protein